LSNWHDKKLKPVFEDLRAKDSALEAQDAQLARVDAALQAQLDANFLQLQNTLTGNMNTLYTRMLPIGSVIMWGLPLEQKPDNFEVCDGKKTFMYQGKSYTVPDLQGRFALGVGAGRDKNNKQLTFNLGDGVNNRNDIGEYEHKLSTLEMPSHSHTGTTSSAGAHRHLVGYKHHRSFEGAKGDDHPIKQQGGSEHYSSTSGDHTHKFTTDTTGSNTAHNNMPPYFALHYLIKIAN
jgi:microcystin-dependent protein